MSQISTSNFLNICTFSQLNEKLDSFESTKSDLVSSWLGQKLSLTASSTWANIVSAIKGVSLSGNAGTGQVLANYTFYKDNLTKQTGTIPVRGNLNWSDSNTTYSVPSGYYSGGTLDSRPSYNAGVTAADNRANTNSVNYQTGYNAGVAAGKSTISKLTEVAAGTLAVNNSASVSYTVTTAGYYLLVGTSNRYSATFTNTSSATLLTDYYFPALYDGKNGTVQHIYLLNATAGQIISGTISASTECRLIVLQITQ